MKTNLFKSFFLALIAAMLPQLASAYDFMVDGLCYNFNDDSTSVSVTYGDDHYNGDIIIPESVTYDSTTYSVTSIGEGAFSYCTGLTSVTIPNSVTRIGNYAFKYCTGLTQVNISDIGAWCNINFRSSDSNPLYYAHDLYLNGNKVTDLTIPNSVTSIGNYAFCNCSGLTSVTIPNSVTKIGEGAFVGSGLTSITLPESLTVLGSGAFQKCESLTLVIWNAKNCRSSGKYTLFTEETQLEYIIFGEEVETIGGSKLFVRGINESTEVVWNAVNCTAFLSGFSYALKKITIGNEVKIIPNNLCAGCSGLTSVTIPNSVTSIGDSAFSGCSGLTSVTIPNSVTTIGGSAFSGCSGLTSVTIPNSVTTIGDFAFKSCLLNSVAIPNSVDSIGFGVFAGNDLSSILVETGNVKYDSRENCNAIIETNTNSLVQGCRNTIFPNSISSIGDYAFSEVYDMVSVTIPNSVTSIGNYAFQHCSGLTYVTIPNSVTSIGNRAFYFDDANECTIKMIHCEIIEPIAIDWSTFNGCYGAFLYVPQESVELYKSAAYWGGFSHIVEEGASFLPLGTTFEDDGIKYSVNNDYTSLSVITNEYTGNIVIPEYATFHNSSLPVTAISDSCFMGCNSLTSVGIPNSVTSIGDYAFMGCKALNSIIIPNSLTSIGNYAFVNCSCLTSITIPNSVDSIGLGIFAYCSNLSSIVVETGNPKYDCRENCNAIIETGTNTLIIGCNNTVIPNTVTSIYEDAFYGFDGITSVIIPNSVISIGNTAFCYCHNLSSVVIPKTVISIGINPFNGCYELSSIVVETENPKYDSRENCNGIIETETNNLIAGCKNTMIPISVTKIGDYAFAVCDKLTSVVIPNSVTTIGEGAFWNCSGLTSVNIPSSVNLIGEKAFEYCYYLANVTIENTSNNDEYSETEIGYGAFNNCLRLASVTLGNSVKKVGDYAFWNCRELTNVTFGNSLSSIGNYAFGYCLGLKSFAIPNSITSLDSWFIFYNCTNLEKLSLPNSLNYISTLSLVGSNNLKTIISHIYDPNSVNYQRWSMYGELINLFYGVDKSNCILYVPKGTKDSYLSNMNWNDFENIIEMVDGDVNGDGNITATDITELYNYLLNGDLTYYDTSDINGDGNITAADITAVYNLLLGNKNK